MLSAGSLVPPGEDGVPKAYLNYLLFDYSYNHVYDPADVENQPWDMMTSAAKDNPEELTLELTAPVDGFMYIYVANETDDDVNVFFDNLTITHTGLQVVEHTDYYPYGMVMRKEVPDQGQGIYNPYRFGYQGQFAEKDEETGWNHFELRNYDSKTGRWTTMDPYRQFYSPYNGMGNNPIYYADPNGGCVDPNTLESIPCPDGVPEDGNEDLRVLSGIDIEGSWSIFEEALFNLGYTFNRIDQILSGEYGIVIIGPEGFGGTEDFATRSITPGMQVDYVTVEEIWEALGYADYVQQRMLSKRFTAEMNSNTRTYGPQRGTASRTGDVMRGINSTANAINEAVNSVHQRINNYPARDTVYDEKQLGHTGNYPVQYIRSYGDTLEANFAISNKNN